MKKKTSVAAARFCSIANRAMSHFQGGFSAKDSPAPLHAADQGLAAAPMTAFPPSVQRPPPKYCLARLINGVDLIRNKHQTYLSGSLFQRHLSESISLDVTAEVCEGLTRGRSSRRTWSIHIVK